MAMDTGSGKLKRPERRSGRRSQTDGARLSSLVNVRTALLLLLGAAFFTVTLQISISGAFRAKRPQLTLQLAPYDAEARSRLAARLSSASMRDEARSLALDAVRRDPVQPVALRVLAESLGDSDNPAAFELISAAQRLSRRDLPAQMWLINYYGRRGEVETAIHHFDLALRSSESSRMGIFPLLEASAAEPGARNVILKVLAERAAWTEQFAGYAASVGRDLEFDADIARLLLNPQRADQRNQGLMLVGRLAQADRYETAWDLYTRGGFAPRAAASVMLRNGNFEKPEDGSPFDWNLAQEPDLWAARERAAGSGGTLLRLAATNGKSGVAAWQALHLNSGVHRLTLRTGDTPADAYERPEFRIECVGGLGRRLLTLKPKASAAAAQTLSETFTVPQSCRFQRLSVHIAGEGALKDLAPWIDDVAIH